MKRIRTRKLMWVCLALIAVLACIIVYLLIANKPSDQKTNYDSEINTITTNINTQTARIDKLEKPMQGDVCVCLGDSITGNYSDSQSYTSVIAEQTGMTVINGGFGGCRMAKHDGEYSEYDVYSMYRLADAIASGDWSLQEQYADRHNPDYTPARIAALKELNWSEVDYITIFFGRNDIQGHVNIDNEKNPLDTTTYMGALRYSIEKIQRTYPNIKILLVTPIFTYFEEDGVYSDKANIEDRSGDFHAYTDWCDGLIEVAKEYCVPYVDLYRTLGVNRTNFEYFFSEEDGIHPNANGIARIGDRLSTALMTQF